ncbi:MAG: oligogalacturonate lyase family protein [Bacteroidales bacterium]|nr:oligogalacturonate lyase family protein [Bacteroidales bacterium]
MNRSSILSLSALLLIGLSAAAIVQQKNKQKESAIPILETGGQAMPDEWVDRDTGHRIIKLTRRKGANRSFYFHNNPFISQDEMLFVGSEEQQLSSDMYYASTAGTVKQMYAVNLSDLSIRQITDEPQGVSSEICCLHTRMLYFQRADSVFCTYISRPGETDTLGTRFIARMPEGRTGHIVCVNCDGTRLAGTFDNPEEGRILREHPKKSDFFNRIFEARLEKTIFTIDTQTGQFADVWTDHAWLNHLQFSPTDPNRLLFCHEGHWHKVDRIWNIDIRSAEELAAAGLSDRPVRQPVLMHKRTTPGEYVDSLGNLQKGEIAGHEWFGADGKHVYFDLQRPRSVNFYVGKVNVETLEEEDYAITCHEWAVHFTTSWDEQWLAGDGGSPTSVAHSDQDQWIYRYFYQPHREGIQDSLRTERLVNMQHHNYSLEPNVHVSPDQKWIIFRANFEGYDNIYAVEVEPYDKTAKAKK